MKLRLHRTLIRPAVQHNTGKYYNGLNLKAHFSMNVACYQRFSEHTFLLLLSLNLLRDVFAFTTVNRRFRIETPIN